MATTEVSLSCVICFDEFDLKERIPVVLPCGHTYVCVMCAKRLKRCMECREPLFWNPPRPPPPTNHNIHGLRYSRNHHLQHYRYSPGNTTTTPPHPGSGRGIPVQEKKEEIPLPLPNNLVLLEMIEAKERQARILIEAKKMRREELLKQRREKLHTHSREQQRITNQKEVKEDRYKYDGEDMQRIELTVDSTSPYVEEGDAYDDEDEMSVSLPLGEPSLNNGYASLSRSCGTYVVKDSIGLVVLSQNPNRQLCQQQQNNENDDEKKEHEEFPDGISSILHHREDAEPHAEPFTIEQGQKVQVVGKDEHGVYKLSRERGYIVATVNQLVKVGGPLESSCKLEGMLQSVVAKQEELHKNLNAINNLATGLREKIIVEQERSEDVPVISYSNKSSGNNNNHNSNVSCGLQCNSHPCTPTNRSKACLSNSPIGGSGGVESTTSANSTAVELGAPRTPSQPQYTPGQHIEMEQHSSSTGFNSTIHSHQQYVYSPAHSCPMPINAATLDQPFLDDSPAAPVEPLRYRVNNDDDVHVGWANVLGCGSSLFGERVIESSRNETSNIFNTNSNGHDILALSFDENSIMQHSNLRQRQVAADVQSVRTAGVVESNGSADSLLRRGGSFDGVNFRTGMSGHRGLGQPRRERQYNNLAFNNSMPRR